MLIKYSNAKIVDVIKDDEHNLDDNGTRKALAKAAEEAKKETSDKERVEEGDSSKLEN